MSQVTLAHSPDPVSTLTSTSLNENTLSMKSSEAPQAGTASGRQALNIQVPRATADRGQRRQRRSTAYARRPKAAGVMQRGDQKHHAQHEYADALENAQRTGLQMHHELRVIGVGQQAHASQKPEKVPAPRCHQRRMSACAASICLATSSSEEWRISLPCTM